MKNLVASVIIQATKFVTWLVSPKLRHINDMLADEKSVFETDLKAANWCDPLDRVSYIYDVASKYRIDPIETYIHWRQLDGRTLRREHKNP